MTDFLTNLAARAIATPALRPRTRLRFEPAPEGEGTPSFVSSPVVRSTAPALPRTELTPVSHAHAPERDSDASPPDAAPVRQPAIEERRRETRPIAKEMTTERILDRRVERESTTFHRLETRVEHDVSSPARINVATTGTDPARETRVPPPHRYDDEPPRLARESRAPSSESAPPRPSTPIDSPVPTRPDVPAARIVSPEPQPRPEGRVATQQPVRRTPLPAAEPTVQVTIGRVEVRAVTSPPTSSRAPRRNATMTIDDYIAKRNARERR